MNHTVLTEYLADYLEGDLALDKRALVDAHLDGCDACKQEVREMQQTIRLLRALPEPELPPMIAANVMRRIRAGEAEPSFFERLERIFGGVLEPGFALPAAAVAVAALVIFTVQGGGPLSRALDTARESGLESAARSERPSESVVVAQGEDARDDDARDDEVSGDPTHDEAGAERAFGASVAGASETEGEVAIAGRANDVDPAIESDESAESLAAAAPRVLASEEMMPVAAQVLRERRSVDPWPSRSSAPEGLRGGARRRGQDAGIFGADPRLAQGFAAGSGGAGSALSAAGDASGLPGVLSLTVAGPAGDLDDRTRGAGAVAGEEVRDVWLNRALENPGEFARYIESQNLAEQELWIARLGERAHARGLMGDLIEALRSVSGGEAGWLADDFAAQARALESEESTAQPEGAWETTTPDAPQR